MENASLYPFDMTNAECFNMACLFYPEPGLFIKWSNLNKSAQIFQIAIHVTFYTKITVRLPQLTLRYMNEKLQMHFMPIYHSKINCLIMSKIGR